MCERTLRPPATTEIFNELRRMRDTTDDPAEMILPRIPSRGHFRGGLSAEPKQRRRSRSYSPTICRWITSPTLRVRINAVTAEQAQAVAQKYILPEKMIVLAVGDGRRLKRT